MRRGALVGVLVAGVSAVSITATVAVVSAGSGPGRVQRPPAAAQVAPLKATVTSQIVEESYVFSGKLAAASAARPLSVEGVVTALPRSSGSVPEAGAVLVEVNGRPVVGLSLPFPLWRDITADMTGRDVEAVQQALKALGYFRSNITGTFAASTQEAVTRLYGHLRYSSPAAAGGGRADGETGAVVNPKAKAVVPKAAGVVLPMAETAALGGGPWKLDLHGAVVGTILGGEQMVSLSGAGTRLDVEDEGRLAEILKSQPGGAVSLVSGTATKATSTKVLSVATVEGHSVVDLTPASTLEPGTASGSVIIRRTASKVLALPVSALRPAPDGRTVVRLLAGTVGKDVPVTVGLRGDRLVEVHGAGLVTGATVELP